MLVLWVVYNRKGAGLVHGWVDPLAPPVPRGHTSRQAWNSHLTQQRPRRPASCTWIPWQVSQASTYFAARSKGRKLLDHACAAVQVPGTRWPCAHARLPLMNAALCLRPKPPQTPPPPPPTRRAHHQAGGRHAAAVPDARVEQQGAERRAALQCKCGRGSGFVGVCRGGLCVANTVWAVLGQQMHGSAALLRVLLQHSCRRHGPKRHRGLSVAAG